MKELVYGALALAIHLIKANYRKKKIELAKTTHKKSNESISELIIQNHDTAKGKIRIKIKREQALFFPTAK